ncbi:hypothetical protein EV127DRAFT_160461 [Xylaria flabelliformis]|nr:hypothetical protein EV127DRAFT_160461 [Xylaria flabelliformis]
MIAASFLVSPFWVIQWSLLYIACHFRQVRYQNYLCIVTSVMMYSSRMRTTFKTGKTKTYANIYAYKFHVCAWTPPAIYSAVARLAQTAARLLLLAYASLANLVA